jgi:rod shape determining protein RodA
MMIAVGLATMILFQILVNVGMVIGVMPVTGIPLPFVTYGGSSLISLLFGMGILESIRMRAHKPAL